MSPPVNGTQMTTVEQDRPAGSAAAEPMTMGELRRRYDEALASCAAMKKHEEDTEKMLAGALHDLKNPISTIIFSCEYLSEYAQENLEPEQLEMIAAIEASAQTLLRLSGGLSRVFVAGGESDVDRGAVSRTKSAQRMRAWMQMAERACGERAQ